MQKVDVTFGRTATVWWSFFWREKFFYLIFGVLFSFFDSLIGSFSVGKFLLAVAGVVGFFLVSIWCMGSVFDLPYKDFEVCLIKNDEESV